MAELVVYLAGEFLAETAISYFAIGKEAMFLRAAIRAGSFVLTTKAAQSMGLIGGSAANELKGQTINVRSSTAPRQLIYGQSLVGGVMFYAATTGTNNEYLHTVFGLADHQIQSVEKVYFGDEDVGTVSGSVSSGRYSGKARIQHKTSGGTAYSDLVTETASLTNKWTSSHKLTGISSVYVRMQYDTSVFTSIPTVRALVKGKLVYDPRSTTTAWSDNPALCIRDYIMSDYGMRVTADEIDSASFIAAANICDETVTASGSVTQKRYTLNGVVDTSKSPREVLQDMLSTCAGMLIYSSGKYKLIVGAFSSPVQTITVDDLRGDVQLSCANEKANLFNRVSGVFADADKLYSATEYPAIASSTFKTQDGGEELTAQLDLNFTTNNLEAQRLAKINLLKSRQGIVVNISCKPTCLNITAGDVVALTIAQLGWSGKYFRVMEWRLNEDIGVDLVLKEEDSTAYDWSTSDAQDGAPNTSLTLIQPQAAPTNLTATNQNLSLPDGTILPAAHITWDAVSSAYVTGYELQFKLSTDTVWQSLFTSQTVYDYAGQQEVALQYNIRVRAIFSDKEGPFSSTINHTLSGDTTAPSAPTSLSAVGAYKTIQLSWTNPTAADWFYNEVWENSTNNSSTATKIGEVSSSTFARSGLPASTTKYYWLKAVDFSRNVSGFSGVASATTDVQVTNGTDGATGPRNAQVYFYYNSAQSSAPTAPTTSEVAYNFSTSTPSISASGWSTTFNPSAVSATSSSNKYWAIRVIFQEIDFGGSYSETISSVFTWQNLNGLVTFTNLADGLNSGGSEATFIDGGSIIANSLQVDKITSGTTSTLNGGVFSLGNAGVTLNGYSGVGGFETTTNNRFALMAFQETPSSNSASAIGACTYSNGAAAIGAYSTYDLNYNSFYTAFNVATYVIAANGRYNRSIGTANNMALIPVNSSVLNGYDNAGYFAYYGNSASTRIAEAFIANTTTVSSFVGRRYDTSGVTLVNEIYLNNGSYSAQATTGSIYSSGGYLPFTGTHDGLIEQTENVEVGDIVVDYQIEAVLDISNIVMLYKKSSTKNQKGVIGVCIKVFDVPPSDWNEYENTGEVDPITGAPIPNPEPVANPMFFPIPEGQKVIHLNALGEGLINVCGESGNIEIGDLIVTSSIAGKGMKQSDDIVRSFTIAKARQSVTFASPTEIQQIACIYLGG